MTELNKVYVLEQLIKDPMFMWLWHKVKKDGMRIEDYTIPYDKPIAIAWPEDWTFTHDKKGRLCVEWKVEVVYQGPDVVYKGVLMTDRLKHSVIQSVESHPDRGVLIRADDAIISVWTLSV